MDCPLRVSEVLLFLFCKALSRFSVNIALFDLDLRSLLLDRWRLLRLLTLLLDRCRFLRLLTLSSPRLVVVRLEDLGRDSAES